jgi:gamma-glutamyl hercynylcysteine S-oxide synthase
LAAQLATLMVTQRAATLAQFAAIPEAQFCRQAHPDFSPVGWHLGHIGYTESLWLLDTAADRPALQPWQTFAQQFIADGGPKAQRQVLPDRADILDYLATIRQHSLTRLTQTDFTQSATQQRWYFLLQHESQHCETVAIVSAQLGQRLPQFTDLPRPSTAIHIPAGGFWQGLDAPIALDNERRAHWVELDDYWIDRAPVRQRDYAKFIAAGGYTDRQWWCEAGWNWLQAAGVTQPTYWQTDQPDWPVCGVSWYEAAAYARFVGRRLPTEAEWEKAAQSPGAIQSSMGQVWEWTDSWFAAYPGFRAFPYPGYSSAYFDQAHRVLRGGSWATADWTVRSSFRNWYHPWTNVIFAGFRTATDRAC